MLLGLTAAGVALAAGAGVAWVVHVANTAPPIDTKKPIELGATSAVYAADGTRLGFITGDILRTPVDSDQIPQNVKDATIAVEDRRFYEHKGVDFEGIVRAAIKNVENKRDVQGGSTLTMQLVRNLYTGEKARKGIAGYKRKIREAKLAEELENIHPGRRGKNWILTKYLNSVPYGTVGGQTAVGIQAASRIFFNKPASKLKLHEAALLAGLPQAPTRYNAFLSAGLALTRRNDVLQKMADQGYISQATADRQKAMKLDVQPSHYYSERREGYFFDFVKQELIDHYGLDTVRRGGLRVDTTLDLKLQEAARKSLVGHLGAPDRAGAIVTMDPKTGRILAMASSSQYADSKFNLAAQGHRQAGSTFKVMVLMDALNRGVDPNSTSYVSRHLEPGWLPSNPSYEVQTYSHGYKGRINLVQATLQSDNTVYAQLDADLGPASVTRTAKDMGITSPLESFPAEGLGGLKYGVSPLEMTRAYGTIANAGWRVRPVAITKVTFPSGRVDNALGKVHKHKAFSDGVTYEATQILEKNVQAGTGTAAQIGCPAAGKTGTVDNYTDAWFVGFTPRLVTTVWVGHPHKPYPLGPGAAGGVVAAPIWGAYMKTAHGKFCGDFAKPRQPFVAQPFFGKYSKSGGSGKPYNDNGTNRGSFELPPGSTSTSPYQSTTPDQGTTTGTQSGKYPPQLYSSPPQQAPKTKTPPGQQKKKDSSGTGGGTAAPPGQQ